MRKRRVALALWAVLSVVALAAGLAGCQPGIDDSEGPQDERSEARPGRSVGAGPEEAQPRTLDVPASGVHLGWGWDSEAERPRSTVCIEFEMARDEGQTKHMTFREVSDSYEVMTSMGMSAAATVDAIGYKASGKAEFAKSARTSGFSSTFVLTVAIDNGVVFAAPVPAGSSAGRVTYLDPERPTAHHGAVRLTGDALALARRGEEPFRQRCGDSFVSALYGGAQLTALITIQATTHAEQEAVSAELSGSGWGVEVQSGFSSESTSETSKHDTRMSFFQVGGRGDSIPKHKDDLLDKLAELPGQAASAPATFRMTLTPYTALANWPSRFDIEVDTSEHEQIASDWGAYATLYDEIQEVLDVPDEYTFFVRATEQGEEDRWLPPDAGSEDDAAARRAALEALEALQDEVHETLRYLRDVAARCADPEEECEFDEGVVLDPYGVRVRLPLPEADTDLTVEHLVDFHVRDTAQRRCDISPINPGCLSNAEVDAWVTRARRHVLFLERPGLAEALRSRQTEDGEGWYEVLPGSRHVYYVPSRAEDLDSLLAQLESES